MFNSQSTISNSDFISHESKDYIYFPNFNPYIPSFVCCIYMQKWFYELFEIYIYAYEELVQKADPHISHVKLSTAFKNVHIGQAFYPGNAVGMSSTLAYTYESCALSFLGTSMILSSPTPTSPVF